MAGALFLAATGCDCGSPEALDAAGMDVGPQVDSGLGDSGRADSGRFDGGMLADGGRPDGGSDAGPVCMNTLCGTACVDLDTDPLHCGSCDTDCTTIAGVDPDAVACVAGVCDITGACATGLADCTPAEGCETDIATAAHCGACAVTCAEPTPLCASTMSGAFCVGGCEGATPDRCDSSCVNITNSTAHCGGCGMACTDPTDGSAVCMDSMCSVVCDSGHHACGSACPANDDATACGASCTACVVPANAVALCTAGSCGFSCLPSFADCDGLAANGCEVDLRTDAEHCGACATACSLPSATAVCTDSLCAIQTCATLTGDCNGIADDGCEVNLATETASCGACGQLCALDNAAESCAGGLCMLGACESGFGSCDADAANGCETNTNVSLTHCGSCGALCSLANAAESCVVGTCTLGACSPGFADCDSSDATGCEINLDTSVANCGTCGNICDLANATETCASGACAVGTCDTNYQDCDASAANGCEVNTQTSASNCGSCGSVCNIPNATATCTAGACGVLACNAGFADCDGSPANGCEVNILTSATSCGACGMVCNPANASGMCVAGSCGIAACNAGFANCDGNPANGCEVNTLTSNTSCGACGNVCTLANASSTCSAGSCGIGSCNAGFANCNGLAADGCEVNIRTSAANCGGCGVFCGPANATGLCSAGACTIGACNAGFANCNASAADGCEVNTTNSVGNCGACGNNCSINCAGNTTAVSCNAGSCGINACAAGYFNVDNLCSGGCECLASAVSPSCAAPANLGTINLGGLQSASANLVPAGQEAWYTVTFTGNTSTGYHPHVRFTANPGNAYRFAIQSDCAGATLSCGEGGVPIGVTDWESFVTDPFGYYNAIPPVGTGGTILIRVFRAAGSPLACAPFTLSVTN